MDKRKTVALACLVFIGGFLAGQTSKVNQINNKNCINGQNETTR